MVLSQLDWVCLREWHGAVATTVVALVAAALAVPAAAEAPRIVQISAGDTHTCALDDTGQVWCWGKNDKGQIGDGTTDNERLTPVRVSNLGNAAQVAAGWRHTCAVLRNGRAKCWGFNTSGQIGDNTTADRPFPVRVHRVRGATQIAADGHNSCAVLGDGRAKCWGWNANGQIGDGTTTDRRRAVRVHRLRRDAAQIEVGSGYACALLGRGIAKCWGKNSLGELGDGTTTQRLTPVRVRRLRGAVQIGIGERHGCALLENGRAKCWGQGGSGQLGDGTETDRRTPVRVRRLRGAVQIAAGRGHSCAVLDNGRAKCWGAGGNGQLGIGTNPFEQLTPIRVRRLRGVIQLAAGRSHSCGLLKDGRVKCWGANWNGQIGDGTTSARLLPVFVQFPG